MKEVFGSDHMGYVAPTDDPFTSDLKSEDSESEFGRKEDASDRSIRS